MNTNAFGRIGINLMDSIKGVIERYDESPWFNQETSMDLSPILPILKHCHIREGYTIDAYPPEIDGMSIPYARHTSITPISPRKYPGIRREEELPSLYLPINIVLEVEACPEGVWEAFLLWDLPRHLPCVQHGAYGMRNLLLDLDDYDSLACISEFVDKDSGCILDDKVNSFLETIEGKTGYREIRGYQSEQDLRMAIGLRGCPLLLPKVVMGINRLYVTYWTVWAGLSRETIKFTRINNTYGFLSLNRENLAYYDWGFII